MKKKPRTHLEYGSSLALHPCPYIIRSVAGHDAAIAKHKARCETKIDKAEARHQHACLRARMKQRAEPEPKPVKLPPPPTLDFAQTNRHSEVTCAGCRNFLRAHPQLWNAMRCADIKAGTARPAEDLIAEAEIEERERADERERRRERATRATRGTPRVRAA